jgi:hypothetical protein
VGMYQAIVIKEESLAPSETLLIRSAPYELCDLENMRNKTFLLETW